MNNRAGIQQRSSYFPAKSRVAGFGAVVALVLWTGANCAISLAQTAPRGSAPGQPRASAQDTVKKPEKAGQSAVERADQDSRKGRSDKPAAGHPPTLGNDTPFGSLGSSNRGPISIQSDSLALDYKQNAVLFNGHVHANQADAQLTSNTLRVKYGKDFHEVQDMAADGNVRISQGVRWCSSERAVMNQSQHTVTLTGSPICHDGGDQIAGTRIIVHLDTGKSDVEAAKAMIFPQQSKTRDNEARADQAK